MTADNYQRTALVLGGGGGRGSYEAGVWKALRELDINIDMVVGTSVGAINASMVAIGDYDNTERLWLTTQIESFFEDMDEESVSKFQLAIANVSIDKVFEITKQFFTEDGGDGKAILELLERYAPEDAIRRSDIKFGLVTAELPLMKGHMLFAEEIPVGSLHRYILASAACFPFSKPVEIDGKKFVDGGFFDNLPIRMVLDKDMDRIISVDLHAAGRIHASFEKKAEKTSDYYSISTALDLGSYVSFGRESAVKNIKLGYLDTMKRFGRYDGNTYTFEKDIYNANSLNIADDIALALKLNPLKIYNRSSFEAAVKKALIEAQIKLKKSPVDSKRIKTLLDKIDEASLIIYIANNPNTVIPDKLINKHKAMAEFITEHGLLLK